MNSLLLQVLVTTTVLGGLGAVTYVFTTRPPEGPGAVLCPGCINGVCTPLSNGGATCLCNRWYYGLNCTEACPNLCSGAGDCTLLDPNTLQLAVLTTAARVPCAYDPSLYCRVLTSDIAQAVRDPSTDPGSVRTAADDPVVMCACAPNRGGLNCSVVCQCNGRGQCQDNGACACTPPFFGAQCQFEPVDCSRTEYLALDDGGFANAIDVPLNVSNPGCALSSTWTWIVSSSRHISIDALEGDVELFYHLSLSEAAPSPRVLFPQFIDELAHAQLLSVVYNVTYGTALRVQLRFNQTVMPEKFWYLTDLYSYNTSASLAAFRALQFRIVLHAVACPRQCGPSFAPCQDNTCRCGAPGVPDASCACEPAFGFYQCADLRVGGEYCPLCGIPLLTPGGPTPPYDQLIPGVGLGIPTDTADFEAWVPTLRSPNFPGAYDSLSATDLGANPVGVGIVGGVLLLYLLLAAVCCARRRHQLTALERPLMEGQSSGGSSSLPPSPRHTPATATPTSTSTLRAFEQSDNAMDPAELGGRSRCGRFCFYFRTRHFFLNLCYVHPLDNYTFVKRWTVFMCHLFTALTVSALWYGRRGGFGLMLGLGLATSLILMPLQFLLLQLFRRYPDQPPEHPEHSEHQQPGKGDEEESTPTGAGLRNEGQQRREETQLDILAYGVALLLIVWCAYTAILFSIRFGEDGTSNWMIVFLSCLISSHTATHALSIACQLACCPSRMYNQAAKRHRFVHARLRRRASQKLSSSSSPRGTADGVDEAAAVAGYGYGKPGTAELAPLPPAAVRAPPAAPKRSSTKSTNARPPLPLPPSSPPVHTSAPSPPQSSLCNECDTAATELYCADCRQYLCYNCSEDLHKSGSRAMHQISRA